jgi:peptide/nickel transport system permease protein
MAVQYVSWIGGIFRGDWGLSIFYNEPVGKLIAERLPVSIHL